MSTRALKCGRCNTDHPSSEPCPESFDRPRRPHVDQRYRDLCADLGTRIWLFYNSNGAKAIPTGPLFDAVLRVDRALDELRGLIDQADGRGNA